MSPELTPCNSAIRFGRALGVVAVIVTTGLASTWFVYRKAGTLNGAMRVAATANLDAIKTALTRYRAMTGGYPSTAQGLDALVHPPVGEPKSLKWLPMLGYEPVDPWGHQYVYAYPGHVYAGFPDVSSAGPDGLANTADDIRPN